MLASSDCFLPHTNGSSKLALAGRCLREGGIVVFPTETFYAIGCRVHASPAIEALCQIKDRPKGKPLPLAAASLAQVAQLCATQIFPAELFRLWPAPLTFLLPLRAEQTVDSRLRNSAGEVAIRVSSHPLVRELARLCSDCITVSSANCSGKRAVRHSKDLDPLFLSRLAQSTCPWILLREDDIPSGLAYAHQRTLKDLPSTIVRPLQWPARSAIILAILRKGAFPQNLLHAAHFFSFWPRSASMQKMRTCPHCGKEYAVYCNPLPAADVIIYEPSQGIVVIRRANTPVGYAIPGGFIEEGECAEAAAIREMREETGLDVVLDGMLGLYSNPKRDPRFHTMTVVYVGHPKDWTKLKAGDDAANAAFYPLQALPHPLVFDHEQVVRDFLDYLAGKRALAPLDVSASVDPNSGV